MMREYGKKSFQPETLFLSCQGLPGADNEPMSLVRRKLAQNILLAAYREPLSVQELCMELGTAAAYIEDELSALVANQLMKQLPGEKYQTDFVILPGQNATIADRIYEACFPDYYTALIGYLEENKALLTERRFNTAGFSWERLLWVYLHVFTDIMLSKYKHEECHFVTYQDIPLRPNGGRWVALGFHNGWMTDAPQNHSAKKEYDPFDGPVHKTDREFAQGFFHSWSGLDSNVFFEIPDGVFALCREIVKKNLSIDNLNEEQKYLFGIAVSKKLFVHAPEGFKQNYYYVDHEVCDELTELALGFYDQVKVYFDKAYRLILAEYQQSVPKHLHWQMGNFLSNHLGRFVTCSLYEGLRSGRLSTPDENNREWLSLFASEMQD